MKPIFTFLLLTACAISTHAQQEIDFTSSGSIPILKLNQTTSGDQYARLWFVTEGQPEIWTIRAGTDGSSESDLDIRFFDGSDGNSLFKIDGDDEESFFKTDLDVDGKASFHRTDNLEQRVDIITSGANADSKLRLGSGGSASATIGWDPGDDAIKLIPDPFSFTNNGLIIKDDTGGVRYGFNTSPNDNDRVRIAYDSQNQNEAHLNLISTGSGDLARLALSEGDNSFLLAGGNDGLDPRLYITHNDDGTPIRLMTFEGDTKRVKVGKNLILDPDAFAKGAQISLQDSSGNNKVRLFAIPNSTNPGGFMSMFNSSDNRTITVIANDAQSAGRIDLGTSDGVDNIILDADIGSGVSQISVDQLNLTGGSDFAERFDMSTLDVEAGSIVSIDPEHPGQLRLSDCAYDTKVAGVVSGANDIRPGVLMGQEGTIADGELPVALSGRVYVRANTENGQIHPGDMVTTSSTPGQAMRANDAQRAFGSIIGKAMTSIDDHGYVLLLISLQ